VFSGEPEQREVPGGALRLAIRTADLAGATALGRLLGISAATAQVLLNRGFAQETDARAYLSPRLSELTHPETMVDREAAADRLAHAVRAGERIAVFGDYDVDGTTSAAILAGILEQLGGRVSVSLASRFEGGYGLSDHALDRILSQRPGLLVTCDCGSSDHPRITRARERGVDVIVVDHHLVPSEPLPALAFLNPHRPDCGFGYKGLCSAGLALTLGAAVRAKLGVELDLRAFLDLVALGTIADVAPLDGDNRRLVRAGLALIGSSAARPGVQALRELAKLPTGTPVGAVEVAFRMTPRLNAPGRLGDPELSLALLRARSLEEARGIAARIEQLNDQRRSIEAEVTQAAIAQVRERYGDEPASGVVAAGEGWHRGVLGITAARLTDRFNVPAVVIGIEDGHGHGSCRGPEGYRLFDAVAACRDMLERFGGHQAACGLSLRSERLSAFRAGFEAASGDVGRHAPTIDVDAVIGEGAFSLPTAADLGRLEPLGEGNAEPVFLIARAEVTESRTVGDNHLKLRLRAGGERLSAFGRELSARRPTPGSIVRAVGSLRPDTWNGGTGVELRLLDFELC
jgi:single-stranded-DNA-specific exonuclease